MNKLFLILFAATLLYSCSSHPDYLLSPATNCKSLLSLNSEGVAFNLIYKGDTLVEKIQLSLNEENENWLRNVEIIEKEQSYFNETWEAVNGKNKEVLNEYNFYGFKLKSEGGKEFQLEVRMYDKGFAYRFVFPEGLAKLMDSTKIYFPENFTFWTYNGEKHNIGPVKLSDYGDKVVQNPVVLKTGNNTYFALHEAAIFEHAPFVLQNAADNSFDLSQDIISEGATQTSWRTFILGDRPGDLTESDLLVNLNEPCKIEDTSWIKTGKSMWDWRVWGYKAADGFEYGLNTISHKRLIDFAAENNVQFLLLDADWYGPEFSESSDPTNAREGVNIEECMAYAKEKGIGIILYLNDVGAKKFGLERVLKQFADWGAVGVKYGFMIGSPREKVANTRRIVELCAKNKLMVDFHDGPIAPSGDRRTWPNLVTKEFCHAQADAKYSHFPETDVSFPFINMLAGPLDLTNGWFDLNNAFKEGRPKVFEEIPGTVASEVAKLIIYYTGWIVLPDAPEEYMKKSDIFDCVRQIPEQFDNYKVLDGEIGEFISVARKTGNQWFVASLTNRKGRVLKIKFDFLEDGKKYVATFYEDTDDTHFLNNKEAYRVRENLEVDNNSEITVKLAPGGGNSIWIRPE